VCEGILFELFKTCRPLYYLLTHAFCISLIFFRDDILKEVIFNHLICDTQSQCESIHPRNMGQDQIFLLEGSTSRFGIEVQAAFTKASIFQNLIHRHCRLVYISREFIRIPPKQRMSLVSIHRAKHAVVTRISEFMLE